MNSSRINTSIPASARVLVQQHYTLPSLSIPRLVVDLCTADATRYPFLDHVVAAITLSINPSEAADYKMKNTDFPLLVEPEQVVSVLAEQVQAPPV